MAFDRRDPAMESAELARAIGRVALYTAHLEAELRYNLDDFMLSDNFFYILEGQSLDWLINYTRLLAENDLSGWRSKAGHREFDEKLLTLLDKVGPLRDLRNKVIHGVWGEECYADDCSQECQPRPYSGNTSTPIFHVDRSRMRRKNIQQQRWAVADVERLADEIAKLVEALQENRWARSAMVLNRKGPEDEEDE